MPEPLSYLLAVGTIGLSSAVLARATGSQHWGWNRITLVCSLLVGIGLAVGVQLSSLRPSWPPANALDRLLTIVMPAVLLVESVPGLRSIPSPAMWVIRIGMAVATPRILLHGSVYLSGRGEWTVLQAVVVMAVCSALLFVVWALLVVLSRRGDPLSIPLALCLTIQSAGGAVMMAGYIKGGTAAFAFSAALLGATIGLWLTTTRRAPSADQVGSLLVTLGVVSLFGVLFIGRYFGRISSGSALTMLVAPLLCWVSELPPVRCRGRWFVGTLRLVVVAIPLVLVLVAAKREFDREMSPLLGGMVEPLPHSGP